MYVMMSIFRLASRNFNESEVSMAQNFYDMNDQQLLQEKILLKQEIDRQKKKMEELNSLLSARFFNDAHKDLQRQGKDFGTTTIFSEQEDKVKVSINNICRGREKIYKCSSSYYYKASASQNCRARNNKY